MISPTVIAALVLGVPALVIAYVAFFWRRRPMFWFVVALVLVGLGYLGSTGALREIGALVVGEAAMLEPAR